MTEPSTVTKRKKMRSYSFGLFTLVFYWIYPTLVLISTSIEISYIALEVKSGQINFQSPVLIEPLLNIFNFLLYSLPLFFGFLMYILRRYNANFYIKAVHLRAVYKINSRLWSTILGVFALVLLILVESIYKPLEYSKISLFLNYFLLLITMNLVLILIYRGGVFIFSPGALKRIRRLMEGSISYIVGSEVCELMEHVSDLRKLSLPSYSFLLAEVNTSIIGSLKFAFPRLLIKGIDKALVNIQLSILIGSDEELERIEIFFKKLKEKFDEANLKKRFLIIKGILELLGTVDEDLPNLNKLREKNEIIGYWNLKFRDKLDPYINLISVALLILSIVFGILFGLHILP